MPSHVAVVGAGADVTKLAGGGSGSVITLANATSSSVAGLTISGWGPNPSDGGVRVTGASQHITVTRNVFVGAGPTGSAAAIALTDSANVLVTHNTIVNAALGLSSSAGSAQATIVSNIFAGNGNGIAATGGTATNLQLLSGFNLYYQNLRVYAAAAANFVATGGDLVGNDPSKDPQFVNPAQGDYRLKAGSPAVNAGAPLFDGSGSASDMGPLAAAPPPLVLLFGREAPTCATASSGVQTVELGLAQALNPNSAVTSTLPTAWTTASLSATQAVGTYWSGQLTAGSGAGQYRVYTRSTDAVGNQAVQYQASFPADGTPPTVAWRSPADGLSTAAAGLALSAEASDAGSGVASLYFTVDGQVVGAQAVPAAKLPVGATPRYAALVPLGTGSHRLAAVATDRAGNSATTAAVNVTISGADVATVLAPTDGSATSVTAVPVLGYARFGAAAHAVALYVDDQPAGPAVLADPTAATTAWSGQVTLSGDGPHTIKAGVGGAAPASLPAVTIRLDTQGPTVQAAAPASRAGGLLLSLSGQANDAGSGLALVQASFDGGYQWQTAAVTPVVGAASPWRLGWIPPAGSDSVRYAIQVRASDQAGGSAVTTQSVLVDNVPPHAPAGVSTQVCGSKGCQPLTTGEALQVPGSVKVGWQLPVVDGSGPAQVAVALDSAADASTSRWTATSNGAYTFNLFSQAPGWYYLHLQSKDVSGNTTVSTYGPYCSPQCAALPLTSTLSGSAPGTALAESAGPSAPPLAAPAAGELAPIVIDGDLGLDTGEWDAATQRMGEDDRPEPAQSLYATWDETNLYFGWRGAVWDRDGTAWLYLDAAPGGSYEPARDVPGLPTLPVQADLAVAIDGSAEGRVLRWDGAWSPLAVPDFRHANGADGDTEILLPRALLGGAGPVRWVALGVGASGRVASIFPTANPLAGPWTYAYRWAALDAMTVPNAGQPGSHHLRVRLDDPSGALSQAGPDQPFELTAGVDNVSGVPAQDVTLVLSTTTGLDLVSVVGAPPSVPGTAHLWRLPLGDVPAGGMGPFTVRLRVAADIAGLADATLVARLEVPVPSSEPDISRARLTVRLDGGAPVLRIWQPEPAPDGTAVVRSGPVELQGTAVDTGAGLARVERRLGGVGAWEPVEGTFAWRSAVDLPAGGRLLVELRGVDVHGVASPPVSLTLVADDAPPLVTIDDLPTLMNGRTLVVRGSAEDSAGQGIDSILIQLDDGPWMVVPGPYPSTAGSRVTWDAPLVLPAEEGVTHGLRARAVDVAGNEGPPSAVESLLVDNVGPRSSIAAPTPLTPVVGDTLLVWGHTVDGVGVAGVRVSPDGGATWQPALLGAEAAALISGAAPAAPGAHRVYLPVVHKGSGVAGRVTLWAVELRLPPGPVALRVQATDTADNPERLAPPLRLIRAGESWPARVWLPWVAKKR
jgi:hypothetical protein